MPRATRSTTSCMTACMSMVASQLEDALYGVNTDALKNSETLRLEKQQEVKDIIRNLPSLDI